MTSKGAAAGGAKGAQSAPIYSLPHDEQVDLLAQALLREYMHKKKFKATLEVFDEENPRNEKTVSQRSVMSELMFLSADVQNGLKARGIDTIMEMLCAGRVEKKAKDARLRELRDVIKLEVPTVPQELLQFSAEKNGAGVEPDEDGDSSGKKKKKKKNKDKKQADDGPSDDEDAKAAKKKKKKKELVGGGGGDEGGGAESSSAKEGKKKKKKALTIEDLLDMGEDGDKRQTTPSTSTTAKPAGLVVVADIPTASTLPPREAQKQPPPPAQVAAAPAPTARDAASSSGEGSDNSDDDDDEEEEDYATALRRIRMQEEEEERQHRKARGGADQAAGQRGGAAVWDATDDATEATSRSAAGGGSSTLSSAAGALGQSIASSSSPPKESIAKASNKPPSQFPTVGMELARAVKNCLVGGDRRLPNSFLHQGFTFSTHVPYGLVQHEGGPCGVLAAVQAFALSIFIKSKFTDSVDVRRTALLHGITSILMLAAGNDVRQVVVCDSEPFPPKNSDKNFSSEQIKHMAGMTRRSGFTSHADLDDYVATLVGSPSHSSWSLAEGPGLICLIASILMTKGGAGRGVSDPRELTQNIIKDMDLEGPLIVEHGYCSQELVNLCIQGRATSNVHDGNIVADGGITLGGLTGPLQVGYLSFLEHRGLIKVGRAAKQPVNPIWIVYHESHYTTLFMKAEVRQSDGTSPRVFDLYFWDQQGQQDEEIRLTITLEDFPLPAVPKNALVPYLNDIIRTVQAWALARINWNGTDPLL